MTTFRKTPQRDKAPEKIDFRLALSRLGLDAKIIAENLEHEKRSTRPFKFQDPEYWHRIPLEWVVCYCDGKRLQFERTRESFWPIICDLSPWVRGAHVFRATGDYHRFYRRVFDYFKIDAFDIREFSQEEREAIWKELKRPMRQRSIA